VIRSYSESSYLVDRHGGMSHIYSLFFACSTVLRLSPPERESNRASGINIVEGVRS